MKFELPAELPATVSELDTLLDSARASIDVIRARHVAGEDLTQSDVDELNRLLDAADTLTAARGEAAIAEQQHAEQVDTLISRAADVLNPQAAEQEPEQEPEQVEPASQPEPQPAETEPQREVVVADSRPSFAGIGVNNPPDVKREPGWEMDPSCPGYRSGMGRIGFTQLAQAIDSAHPGSRTRNRPNKPSVGSYAAQVLARLPRDMPLVDDSHALVAAIREATDERKLPGGSLIAAGGWCAPSEQLYNFCDVPNASDLVSLPDLAIRRGGIRWPVEPDLTSIYSSFEWFFTEVELEAVDSGDGEPTAVKTCVDIPCPDEFEEIRLNAVGYCVELGILQEQGWPELIEWFMQSLAQEHLRALSRRTILDMVSGSTAKTIDGATTIGAVSSVLNSLALQAYNLRGNRGLPRAATIEGVAPNWFAEVLRADLAMQEGLDTKAVTDGQITSWLSARNIALQFVGDWQTRGAGEPGHLDTLEWPNSVNVLLYPAGTWFRSLSPVIELGVMYPKEQLQVNRYTRFFTEDAIAVGKRCNASLNVEIPICVSGAISDRQAVECSALGS